MIRPLFKDKVVQREFAQLDTRLMHVIDFMSEVAWVLWRDILVITSIKRNDGTTHDGPKPYRFIDLAILEHGGVDGTRMLRDMTNTAFPYDTLRPHMETVDKLRHGTAPHMHVQVRP